MNPQYAKIVSTVLIFLVVGCSPYSQGNKPQATSESGLVPLEEHDATDITDNNNNSSSQSIGTITNVRTNVLAGPFTDLKNIVGKTDLGNEDFVKVTDGGKARLEFPGPINLLLYNESEIDSIRADVDENSNPRIANRLIRGGFSGYVAPGENLTIDLAFGVQVTVLGTNFFIIYDEKTDSITIGKFDGTLIVDLPNQNRVYLDDNEMIDLTQVGKTRAYFYYKIPFTVNQFDEAVDGCSSPIQGLNILRRDNSIPLPGDVSVNKNQSLPCDSTSQQALIPVTGCLQRYTVQIGDNTIDLREGPDLRYEKIGEYGVGTKFTITGRYTDVWFLGELPDGNNGWLYYEWLDFPSDAEINSICQIDKPPTPEACYSKGKYSEDCP